MPILPSIINWLNFKRNHQISLYKEHPVEIQEETFFKLIDSSSKTEWGKKFNYQGITSIDEFRKTVPLQQYEDIKPYVDRLRGGERNLLWPGDIKWFAKSSGTTSDKSKFIPVSSESLEDCHFRGGKDVLALYARNFPSTNIFNGKSLTLGGSHQIDNFNNQSYYGDLSAILIQNLPFWADFIRIPKAETALIAKWEEKLDKLTKETVQMDVTNLAGVPSWNLVMLKHILDYTGKNNILEVWPNLELFIHGGVSFLPYKEQYQRLIPSDTMRYMETYNASEGFFAIQDEPGDSAMLLMLDYGIFYEFIALDSLNDPQPKCYHIGEVKKGINYAMVISTNGGLWRYLIGDTVVFESLYPHKIRISGRTKHYINAFGEELIIDNAEKAFRKACESAGAIINEYTGGPVYMGDNVKGSHEWIVEFEKEPENLDYFVNVFDHALMSVNSDYEAKRYKDITLVAPSFIIAPKGTFIKWLDKKGKLGGQNKVPRLSNTRKYLDELKEIIQQF